jgi:hypothetical protein
MNSPCERPCKKLQQFVVEKLPTFLSMLKNQPRFSPWVLLRAIACLRNVFILTNTCMSQGTGSQVRRRKLLDLSIIEGGKIGGFFVLSLCIRSFSSQLWFPS